MIQGLKQEFNKLAEPMSVWWVIAWLFLALHGYVGGFWLRATGHPLAAAGAYLVMGLGLGLTLRDVYFFVWRHYVRLVNPPKG